MPLCANYPDAYSDHYGENLKETHLCHFNLLIHLTITSGKTCKGNIKGVLNSTPQRGKNSNSKPMVTYKKETLTLMSKRVFYAYPYQHM